MPKPSTYLAEFIRVLEPFVQDVEEFQRIMSEADETQRARLDIPNQFVTVWLHIMTAMTFGMNGEHGFQQHLWRARSLAVEAMNNAIQGTSSIDLVEKQSVLPMEVLAVLSLGLLSDRVGNGDDISETYSEYLNLLVGVNACSVAWANLSGHGHHYKTLR